MTRKIEVSFTFEVDENNFEKAISEAEDIAVDMLNMPPCSFAHYALDGTMNYRIKVDEEIDNK